jgi:hypothetical protein
MFLDDELERTLDVLTDRLRDDVARQVRSVAEELAAAVRAGRTVVVPVPAPIIPPEIEHSVQKLAAGIRSIGAARSLSEILDVLVRESGSAASRVAVVLVRGAWFQGWRLLGFEDTAENTSLEFAREGAGVIREAAQTAAPASSAGAPAFAHLAPGEPCLALPLAIGGQPVAVLYADGLQGPAATDHLEILVLHAARCLEAQTAIRAARSLIVKTNRAGTLLEARAQA